MKKLLLVTLISYLISFFAISSLYAASYYGCASADITADSTFCDTPTGSCAGDNPQTAATVLAGTHSLFANGCTITIDNTANRTITAAKLSNKDDGGAMVDGGGFTYVTAADYALTLNAAIETGGTTGACLSISGSGAGTKVTGTGAITGGSAAAMYGVNDTHTVGTVVWNGNMTGGSNNTGHAYYLNGTGSLTISAGNIKPSGSTNACGIVVNSVSATTIAGNCYGSDGSAGAGCFNGSTGVMTITGSIFHGYRSFAILGSRVIWIPATNAKYVMYPVDSSAIAGTIDAHAIVLAPVYDSATPSYTGALNLVQATEIKSGEVAGPLTGTMTSGGGGAWGF